MEYSHSTGRVMSDGCMSFQHSRYQGKKVKSMESALILYFSRAGENYVSGTLQYLKKGNTEIAAETIQKLTGGKMFKVRPVVPYAEDYNTCIEEARQDQRKDARPGIVARPDHPEQYDVIYLGYPKMQYGI